MVSPGEASSTISLNSARRSFFPRPDISKETKAPLKRRKQRKGTLLLSALHHKAHNKHHWEYWTDFGEHGEVIANKIPSVYVIEMVCDWIGAGKVYGGEGWTEAEPLEYFLGVRDGRYFHCETEELILDLLKLIRSKGLDEFHRVCRRRYPLFTDYEGLYIP